MTPQEFAAYAMHYMRDLMDFAIDQIGGNCECESENVETGMEVLDSLSKHLIEEANKMAVSHGVNMNQFPDGTPVVVTYDDGYAIHSHVRKPGDSTDPQVLFAGHLRPKLEVVK